MPRRASHDPKKKRSRFNFSCAAALRGNFGENINFDFLMNFFEISTLFESRSGGFWSPDGVWEVRHHQNDRSPCSGGVVGPSAALHSE